MQWRRWLGVVVACLAVTGGLAYYKYRQISAAMAAGAAFPEPIEAVEVAIARESLWQPTTQVTAEVVATRSVDLRADLGGRIERVGFAPGALVAEAQLLVQLDISEEQAAVAAARANAKLARLELERNQKLVARGTAAEAARDRSQASFDAANAQIRQLEAVIAKKTLRAPFAARAGLHQLVVGDYLDAGDIVVRLIGAEARVWVDFTLPQVEALRVAGDTVTIYPSPGNESRLEAPIIARDAFVNERSRQVRFRTVIEAPPPSLVPGSLITADVPVGPAMNAVVIPQTAIRRGLTGASVFVLEPAEAGATAPERAALRPITLGATRGTDALVTKGLTAGDRVAANGSFKLRAGALVQAVEGGPESGPEQQG